VTDTRECYIPLPAHDPDRLARNLAIWQAAGERLGLLPPTDPTEDSET
jgi:hypothetical protein